jgi:hypothetical protein
LNNWIDLIWGYKQRGEQAIASHNVFVRTLYADVWDIVDLNNVNRRIEIEAMLCHVGQIPQQLFDKAHPKRELRKPPEDWSFSKRLAIDVAKPLLVSVHCSEHMATIEVLDEDYVLKTLTYDMSETLRNSSAAPRISKRNSLRIMTKTQARLVDVTIRKNSLTRSGTVNLGGKVCCHHNHSFDIVLDRLNELMTINSTSGAPELKIRHRSGIISVASDEEWTVLADHDSSFSVYKQRKFQFSIPIFTSSVRCQWVLQDGGLRDEGLLAVVLFIE